MTIHLLQVIQPYKRDFNQSPRLFMELITKLGANPCTFFISEVKTFTSAQLPSNMF